MRSLLFGACAGASHREAPAKGFTPGSSPMTRSRKTPRNASAGATQGPAAGKGSQGASAGATQQRPLSSRATRWYVAALCLFGAVRIFLGAAGLPLFNDVDEDPHFDLVHKFARGHWPGPGQQAPDEETIQVLAMYGTVEFLRPPERCPDGVYRPPLWTLALCRAGRLCGAFDGLTRTQGESRGPLPAAVLCGRRRLVRSGQARRSERPSGRVLGSVLERPAVRRAHRRRVWILSGLFLLRGRTRRAHVDRLLSEHHIFRHQ